MKLFFGLEITEAAVIHCVESVASAFGPRCEELRKEFRREKQCILASSRLADKGQESLALGVRQEWGIVYEVTLSREKGVPQRVLGDYAGTMISDSWPAWNHVDGRWQRCLVHCLRELKETIEYKSRGHAFFQFAKRPRVTEEERLRVKAKLEKKVDALIASYSSSSLDQRQKNFARLVKRLRRERGMPFAFLGEQADIDRNNNVAERTLRPTIVIRKLTYGNQSEGEECWPTPSW